MYLLGRICQVLSLNRSHKHRKVCREEILDHTRRPHQSKNKETSPYNNKEGPRAAWPEILFCETNTANKILYTGSIYKDEHSYGHGEQPLKNLHASRIASAPNPAKLKLFLLF